MPRTRPRYPREYRERIVELVRSGRKPSELAREFEPSKWTIMAWVKQADLDTRKRVDGLTTEEREELRRLKRENRILREEKEILKKSRGLVCEGDRLDAVRGFEFVKRNQAEYGVATMCRVLGVSPSGYWAWRKRGVSERAQEDAHLSAAIRAIHARSRKTYGTPRIHAELADDYGVRVGRKRVARLMRAHGLVGVHRRKGFKTTKRDETARPAPDLVDRKFVAKRPNELWVADITYIPTLAGFLFLAVVLDVFSRRIVGWAMARHLRTELVTDALAMAVSQRKTEGVIHHSDQGCQYTSVAFGKRCERLGVRLSMGSVGDCYDNAMCESFFATLETELLDRERFETPAAAKPAIFDFIEGWYNPHRRHSGLGQISPINYERRFEAKAAA